VPAPTLPLTPVAPRAGARNSLARPLLARKGRSLLIATATSRAGILDVRAYRKGDALGGCRTRTPAGRSLTCRLALRPGSAVRGVRVVLRLYARGAVVARRTATYSRVLATFRGASLQCWLGPGAAKPRTPQ
jgi:hypothetical protein